MPSLTLLLVFFSLFFSPVQHCVTISLGVERAGLYASRALVCLSYMRYFLSLLYSSSCRLRLVIVALPGRFSKCHKLY